MNNENQQDSHRVISDSQVKPQYSQGNADNINPTTISDIPQTKSQFLSVLKIRNFMIFGVSQSISLFGDKLNYMALLAMIAFFSEKLGWESAKAISYLSVIITLPTILIGPLAGVLVDRWNRLKVLIFCDTTRAVLVGLIPLLVIKTASLILVYIVTFIVFLFGLFYNTARMSIIPNLVARKRLLAANSFMNVVGRIATFFGMFLGGIIVDWQIWKKIGIQQSWSAGFYIDTLTYLISVLGLVIIASRIKAVKRKNKTILPIKSENNIIPNSGDTVLSVAKTQEKKTFNELKLAFRYIKETPSVLFVFSCILIMVIIGACAFVLVVPIIQAPVDKMGLGLGTKGVGFVAAIGAVGLVISSMSFGIIGHRVNKFYTILVSFIVLGLVTILIPVLHSYIALIPLALIAGIVLSPVFISMDTILHEIVPEEIRGRIFSSREWLMNISFALACLIIGQLTNFITKHYLLIITGSVVVLVSSIYLFMIKKKLYQIVFKV
ncbi:MAG: MFS transporter [Candidatus Latescibacteria bacterium]|nr:MFS transporter [Candidatus Latescibacterota bacterium]